MPFIRLQGGEKKTTSKIKLSLDISRNAETRERGPTPDDIQKQYPLTPQAKKKGSVENLAQTNTGNPNGRCGFATGTQNEINQPGNNNMTIVQSKALLERLQTDEIFRNEVLAADGIEKCMALIESSGYDCTTDEVQMVVNKYAADTTSETCEKFTLWGNRIP
jgi:hypothetical protein